MLKMKLHFSIRNLVTNVHILCILSERKNSNYDRFVDPNILGAARLVHSDLGIYRIPLFLLDRKK